MDSQKAFPSKVDASGKSFKAFSIWPFTIYGSRITVNGRYRLSHIKFHKARGRRLYCNTPTTDNAVKFNM